MIEPVDVDANPERAVSLFHRVFQSTDGFGQPFHDTVMPRALLFPSGYFIYEEQYDVLVRAAQTLREDHAYYLTIETIERFGFEVQQCVLLQLSGGGYGNLREVLRPLPIASALYSTTGSWGAITLTEDHAVIAGPSEFVSTFTETFDFDQQVDAFIEYWLNMHRRSTAPIKWIPEHLAHIYGEHEARMILQRTGFTTTTGFVFDNST